MIYTIGKTDLYEEYINSDPDAAKGRSGMVWETLDSTKEYMESSSVAYRSFGIYMVDADWDSDTEIVDGESWRVLNKSAKLIKI